jgi:hypothetical protein
MLKSKLKHIHKWFGKLIESTISIFRIFLFSSFNPNCNAAPKVSGECYVFGNGPSLKDALSNGNLSLYENKHLFVVNDFVLSDSFELLKPEYYVIADPGYWIEGTFDDMKELRENIFGLLNEKTIWKMTLYMPKQAYYSGFFQKRIENPNINLRFFNTTEVRGFSSLVNFSYSHNLGMPLLQNVLVAAIFLAVNLRFDRINVFGAEHSWLKSLIINSRNEVFQINGHF